MAGQQTDLPHLKRPYFPPRRISQKGTLNKSRDEIISIPIKFILTTMKLCVMGGIEMIVEGV